MDPRANLREQLELARRIVDCNDADVDDAPRLAELVLALNEWIGMGGFLPPQWTEVRKAQAVRP